MKAVEKKIPLKVKIVLFLETIRDVGTHWHYFRAGGKPFWKFPAFWFGAYKHLVEQYEYFLGIRMDDIEAIIKSRRTNLSKKDLDEVTMVLEESE